MKFMARVLRIRAGARIGNEKMVWISLDCRG
jgi:hypothetical protein